MASMTSTISATLTFSSSAFHNIMMPSTASHAPSSHRRVRDLEARKRALDERPPSNTEASKLAEACTPFSTRMSRLTLGSTLRTRRNRPLLTRATRNKTVATKAGSPLGNGVMLTVEENDEHASVSPLVLSKRADPSVDEESRGAPRIRNAPPEEPDKDVNPATRPQQPVTTNNDAEQAQHSQSSKSSGINEDQLDQLDIEILSMGTKKRARASSLGSPSDPEVYDIQYSVEDEPSPRKRRKMKVLRQIPVNELIIVSKRVVPISNDGEGNRRELEGDFASRDTVPKVSHQQPKKQKRKQKKPNQSEGSITIKFPKEKSFKIHISMFHVPEPGSPLLNDINTYSDGFNEKEMKITGRIMPTKRYSSRYNHPSTIVPKVTLPIGQLTIVADRPFGHDVQSPGRIKKRKQKAKTLPQSNRTQTSGIATPPTSESSKRKTATAPSPALGNLELPPQNPRVALLKKGASNSEPARSSSLRHNVERSVQQSQNLPTESRVPKKVLSLEERKDQLRRAEEKNASKELFQVIVSQVYSDSESSEESSEGSKNGDSDENSVIDMDVDSQDFVPEDNASDQSVEENHGLVEDEGLDEDKDEEEEGNVAQQRRDEAEGEVEKEAEKVAEQVRTEEEIEDQDPKDSKDWKPQIPNGAPETEDEIQSSSPVIAQRNRYRPSAFRTPSRIPLQVPIVREGATYQRSTSQGSVILGDSQFGISQRRIEIPETQMQAIVEDEEEVHFSQLSFRPNSSYFDRASQELQRSPRKPSLRNTRHMPPPDILQPFRTPSLGPKRTLSRQPSIQGSANKSLADIAHRTSSQFGTLGSARKKRTVSVPLLSQSFRK